MSSRLSAIDTSMTTFVGAAISPEAGSGTAEDRAAKAAEQIRRAFGATFGLAAVAPDASEGARPGTVAMAVAHDAGVVCKTTILPGDRARMREYAVINCLDVLRRHLDGDKI